MIPHRIKRQLEQVDWDFFEHLPGTSKTIHWYPGTYPADIPTTLIQALSQPDELVFDPYGGVGTTALEAIRQARKAWLVEANPIGCLASYVSCGALLLKAVAPNDLALLVEEIRSVIESCGSTRAPQASLDMGAFNGKRLDALIGGLVMPCPTDFEIEFADPPNTAELSKWIEERTLKSIVSLLGALQSSSIGSFGNLVAKTMVSATLRACSSQTQSWGHIADNVWPKQFEEKDVFVAAQRWLTRFETIVRQTEVAPLPGKPTTRLWVSLHNWARPNPPPNAPRTSANLMVTSPPYAGAIDYSLAQRLSFYAFGYSENEIRFLSTVEFGARRKRNLPHSLEQWAEELADALSKQLEYMENSSFASFVLPHKDAGRDLGTAILEDCLESLNWSKILEVDRSIRQGRARQSWTSIKKETIHIFGA